MSRNDHLHSCTLPLVYKTCRFSIAKYKKLQSRLIQLNLENLRFTPGFFSGKQPGKNHQNQLVNIPISGYKNAAGLYMGLYGICYAYHGIIMGMIAMIDAISTG
jgi:hypothetical protein